MKTHILGNGPSHILYEPMQDHVIGCNFQSYPVDISVFLDCKPFHVYLKDRGMIPSKKVITSRYAMENIIKPKGIQNELDFIEVIPHLDLYVSAGHIAVDWAIRNKYDEIHLWGFDSIWADTQETKTDDIIPRTTRAQFDLYLHWREKWQPYKQHNIIVHNTIEGTQLKDLL